MFNEPGINFDHEDLGTVLDYHFNDGNMWDDPDCAPGIQNIAGTDCQFEIAHGVAGAGIVVGQDNNHGVTGFAPDAHYLNVPVRAGASGYILPATDGIDTGGHG